MTDYVPATGTSGPYSQAYDPKSGLPIWVVGTKGPRSGVTYAAAKPKQAGDYGLSAYNEARLSGTQDWSLFAKPNKSSGSGAKGVSGISPGALMAAATKVAKAAAVATAQRSAGAYSGTGGTAAYTGAPTSFGGGRPGRSKSAGPKPSFQRRESKREREPEHMLNAKAAARLVACTDEVVSSSNMPTIPSSNTNPRYSHVATAVGDVEAGNHNLFCNIPGQTLFCARITNSFQGAVGSMMALNMADPSLMFSLTDAGLTALSATTNVATARLVPRFHLGYQIKSDTVKPGPPCPIEFSSTAAGVAVYFPVYDGAGNYQLLIFPSPNQVAMVIVGDVTIASSTTASSTTAPFTNSSFSQAGVSMTVTPLTVETGTPVRRLFMFDGPTIDDPHDQQAFANYPVTSCITLTNLGSAMDRSFNVVAYGIPTGGDSIYASRTQMSASTTYSGVAPSWATLNTCVRNRTQVPCQVTNNDYYRFKMAARMSTMDFKPNQIHAWEAANAPTPDTVMAATPVQFPGFANAPFNSQALYWSQMTISFVLVSNGSTASNSSYPFSMQATAWMEALVPADVGLVVKMPQYCSEFVNWLQIISSYPVLARAHSFKDWLRTAWTAAKGVVKDAGREIAYFAGSVFRDAAVEALITGAGALAAL